MKQLFVNIYFIISIVIAMGEGDLILGFPHKGEQAMPLSNKALGLAQSF